MLVLVLEASTASAKAMLYDSELGVVKMDSRPYPSKIDDLTSQDTEGVYRELLSIGQTIGGGQNIDVVALSSTWHNIAVLDEKMQPVTRTYSWTDTSPAALVSRLKEDRDFALSYYHTTGCMVHTTYAPFKLLHLKEQGLDLRGKFIIDQGSYNFYRLTGEKICTASMASGLGLLNIHTLSYEQEILERIGISENQLSRLGLYGSCGRLTAEAAAQMELRQGIPVLAAYSDGALNQMGSGAMKQGIMTLSVGTSAALRLTVPKPVISKKPGTWCYVSVVDTWLSGAATAGSCSCVDWLKKHVLENRYNYRELEDPGVDMENLPLFLPFIFGERCPGWQSDRLGGYQELRPSHGAKELFVSALEGILFNIKQCYDILAELAGHPKEIRVSGGVLRSPMWSQMLSDILGKEVVCSDIEQASLLGGAFMAMAVVNPGMDAGLFTADAGRSIEPDPAAALMHERRYRRYLDWYDRS